MFLSSSRRSERSNDMKKDISLFRCYYNVVNATVKLK